MGSMEVAELVTTEVIAACISRQANRRAHSKPPKDTIRIGEGQGMGEIELVGRICLTVLALGAKP
jgi:hypothetical protein